MVDFHTHILPHMDDGSSSSDESLSMLRSYSDRVTTVIMTPHFYPFEEAPDSFLARRATSLERLTKKLLVAGAVGSTGTAVADKKTGIPALRLGAEVSYYEGLYRCEALEQMVISGTRLLLVEMPIKRWSQRMIDELIRINQDYGVRPVLAHLNRYLGSSKVGPDKQLLEYFLSHRGLVQLNAESLMHFGSRLSAIRMFRSGQAQFLGSDAHNMNSRKPNYDEALDKLEKSGAMDVVDIIRAKEEKYILK